MPAQEHKMVCIRDSKKKTRFKVGDKVVLRLTKFTKDEGDTTIYPQEVLKAFIKYFNNLYQTKSVFAERYVVDGPDKSHLDAFLYVPGELTREDFLDDLNDFMEDYPSVKVELIKRWPKANEWNEAHKEEIAAKKVKPRQEGILMAKNSTSAYPKLTLETLLKYLNEEEPVHPYPEASVEELEELERKKDEKLMEFYKKENEYDSHQSDVKSLLKLFEQRTGSKFDKNDESDIKALESIYNNEYDEVIKKEREWYPADVRLFFNVGKFAPNKEGNVDLLSLYDKKRTKDSNRDNSKLCEDIERVLDDYGILYGDIVDNGSRINIVGVSEDEWEEAADALDDELCLTVNIPPEDHEELDDELVVMVDEITKDSCNYEWVDDIMVEFSDDARVSEPWVCNILSSHHFDNIQQAVSYIKEYLAEADNEDEDL